MKRLTLLTLLALAACAPAGAYVGQQPTTPPVTVDRGDFTPVARYMQGTATLGVDSLPRICGPTAVLGTALSCTSQGCTEVR